MKQTISMQQYQVTHITTKIVNNRRIRHEISDDANGFHHRVCWGENHSDWIGYDGIAILAVSGRRFCATTPIYDGVLPELFEVLV